MQEAACTPDSAGFAPKVSVIVPAYRTAQWLDACLESLAAQTQADFEALVVDDGSPDECGEIADAWAARDARFVALHRTNGGLSAARNTGLDAARGTYVMFLDSDDMLAETALEELVGRAEADGLDLVDFSARAVLEPGAVRDAEGYENRHDIPGVMTGRELMVRYMDADEYWGPACFHFARRDLLDDANLRFCEGILHEDELFTPMLHAAAQRACFLNRPLYLRRVRAESIMTRQGGLHNVTSLFVVTQLLYAWLCEHAHELDPAFADAFAMRIFGLRDSMGHYAMDFCTDEELAAFADTLDAGNRADFMIYVVAYRKRIAALHAEVDELLHSRTYRLGDALARLPRKLLVRNA